MTRLILIGGIIWCFVVELTQYSVPERGTSLLDSGGDILGVLIGLMIYQWLTAWQKRRDDRCHQPDQDSDQSDYSQQQS